MGCGKSTGTPMKKLIGFDSKSAAPGVRGNSGKKNSEAKMTAPQKKNRTSRNTSIEACRDSRGRSDQHSGAAGICCYRNKRNPLSL
jgi:hypothetical protein